VPIPDRPRLLLLDRRRLSRRKGGRCPKAGRLCWIPTELRATLLTPLCRALGPRPYGQAGVHALEQNLLTGIADQLAAQCRILKADMRQRRTNRAFSLARVRGHFEVPVIRQWVPVRARRRNVVAAAR
jgi:hypothetical protein